MTHARLPEPHEYQTLGAYMRDLRLYYGLDIAQVGERIHIRTKYIQAIEEHRLEALPGKVYARGYIVTYAEFLGLDAEAVAAQYMGEAATAKVAREVKYFVPEPKRAKPERRPLPWTAISVVAVLVVAAGLLWPREQDEANPAPAIEEVPAHLIEALRTAVMPMAGNMACLMGASLLACHDAMHGAPVGLSMPPLPKQFLRAEEEPDIEAVAEEAAPEAVSAEKESEAAPPAAKTPDAIKKEPVATQKKVTAPAPFVTGPSVPVAKEKSNIEPVVAPASEPVVEIVPDEQAAPASTPAPVAQEPIAQEPPEWWKEGFEQSDDPNARNDSPVLPRRRR